MDAGAIPRRLRLLRRSHCGKRRSLAVGALFPVFRRSSTVRSLAWSRHRASRDFLSATADARLPRGRPDRRGQRRDDCCSSEVFSARKGGSVSITSSCCPGSLADTPSSSAWEQRVWYGPVVRLFSSFRVVALLGERDAAGRSVWVSAIGEGPEMAASFRRRGCCRWVLFHSPTFQRYYPKYALKKAAVSPSPLFVCTIFSCSCSSWLGNFSSAANVVSLRRHLARSPSMQMTFAGLHGGKPLLEAIGSISWDFVATSPFAHSHVPLLRGVQLVVAFLDWRDAEKAGSGAIMKARGR
jgi:hypothetical protein